MPLRVLIAPDKFKGTLSAHDAAAALHRGWQATRPDDVTELLPISDGGDGFGEIVAGLLGAERREVNTVDAAHRPLTASWWYEPKEKLAIIEAARINGLALLLHGQFHPFDLDTFGLGLALRAAAEAGARRVLMGIGGSATNDAGFGLARALGWHFQDERRGGLTTWPTLNRLNSLIPPTPLLLEITVAVDVQNPLLGPQGCTRVYGPQKGVQAEDFPVCDAALGPLAEVVRQQHERDLAGVPGAGAAGGLGFGLLAFASARLEPGFAIFARLAGLEERLRRSDLVLTGEGALDEQTLMGKGVGELALAAQRAGVPCLGIAGVVPDPEHARGLFRATYALTPDFVSREQAMTNTAVCLEKLAAQAAQRAVTSGL